jgi:hypothetical protein
MALTIEEKNICPALLATLSGMIRQPGAAPHAPRPLLASAAATPAHAVPCPGDAELSSGLLSPLP